MRLGSLDESLEPVVLRSALGALDSLPSDAEVVEHSLDVPLCPRRVRAYCVDMRPAVVVARCAQAAVVPALLGRPEVHWHEVECVAVEAVEAQRVGRVNHERVHLVVWRPLPVGHLAHNLVEPCDLLLWHPVGDALHATHRRPAGCPGNSRACVTCEVTRRCRDIVIAS